MSYLTGQRVDLARCAAIARAAGAWLAVDATHALGVAPVPGELCDFVVSSCYKWLLATHGVGIFAYDAARVGPLEPATLGWHSVDHRGGLAAPLDVPLRPDAARLEAGNPSLLGLLVLDNALDVLDGLDPKAVLAHAHELGGELIEGLRRSACPSSRRRPRMSAPAMSASSPRTARGSPRAWPSGACSCGAATAGIRISAHVHDGADDVRRCLDELASIRPRR